MDTKTGVVRVSLEVPVDPAGAFDLLTEELTAALRRLGMRLEAGPDGRLLEDDRVVGRVTAWEPGGRAVLEWRPASWRPDLVTQVEMRVEAAEGRSHLTIQQSGWGSVIGDDRELLGWFASEVAARFLAATAPEALGDWITDRQARRPWGARSRDTYRDPLFHYPNFHAILAELSLTPDDHLVEVGCGGGAFLAMALRSGCSAVAVDHSPDMVEGARDLNAEAIAAGRLDIVEADAASLPLPDDTFTCGVMTGVLGFLTNPVAVLQELRRVLAPGGRIVVMGTDPELRGTPGAPEPIASRLGFHEEGDLVELGRAAGFGGVRAVRRDLEGYAREAGVPEEALPLFAAGSRFLLARKE